MLFSLSFVFLWASWQLKPVWDIMLSTRHFHPQICPSHTNSRTTDKITGYVHTTAGKRLIAPCFDVIHSHYSFYETCHVMRSSSATSPQLLLWFASLESVYFAFTFLTFHRSQVFLQPDFVWNLFKHEAITNTASLPRMVLRPVSSLSHHLSLPYCYPPSFLPSRVNLWWMLSGLMEKSQEFWLWLFRLS